MGDGSLAVILAAGQGSRMKSAVPKILHPLGGQSIIDHVLNCIMAVVPKKPIVVISPKPMLLRKALEDRAILVEQPEPLGTGNALEALPQELRSWGTVLIINGDVPLLRPGSIEKLLEYHHQSQATATLLTAVLQDPGSLGRIVRNNHGQVSRIVEAADWSDGTSANTNEINEINAGVYAFSGRQLWPALEKLSTANAQGEYYLTDIVEHLEGPIEAVQLQDSNEALGINTRVDLAAAQAILQQRILENLMLEGVTIEDPKTTYIDSTVTIGRDSVIKPMSVLKGKTFIGAEAQIGPNAQLTDIKAGDRVQIGASFLENSVLGSDVVVGPYNRLRPGTKIGDKVQIGTHAEVKNSTIGEESFISHFSCVLDSDIGAHVNIGAGTVTCNFDGFGKHRTQIADHVFVGTDSTLIAPVKIAEGAYIAAGSVISQDVPSGALAIERSEQKTVLDWVKRRRQKSQGKYES